jgi:hypothetical protein
MGGLETTGARERSGGSSRIQVGEGEILRRRPWQVKDLKSAKARLILTKGKESLKQKRQRLRGNAAAPWEHQSTFWACARQPQKLFSAPGFDALLDLSLSSRFPYLQPVATVLSQLQWAIRMARQERESVS